MGITEAIAAIVALPDAKAQLNRDPGAFQLRYGLTSAELDALRRASPLGFQLVNNEHRTARLETLQAILPRTLRLLRPAPSSLLAPYMDRVAWKTTSIPGEARRLLQWLEENGGLDPALLDLVRYEILLYELAEDHAASRYAIAHRGSGPSVRPLASSDRPGRSPAARIASFEHDVTATPPTPLAQPLHLLAVKSPDRWGPRVYRLSTEAMKLLLLCDGERTLAEVIAQAADVGSAVTDIPAALTRFVGYGALTR
jgi:hypothetical protein